MTLSIFNRIVVAVAVIVLATFGISTTAGAAPLSGPSVSSSSEIGTSGTNAVAITVSATAITGGAADKFLVNLPLGWSFINADSVLTDGTCPTWFTTTISPVAMCQSVLTSFIVVQMPTGTFFTSGENASVTFAANSINVGASRDFGITFAGAGGAEVDAGTAIAAGGVTNSTVTFNANGGTGAIADQIASAATPLTANVFSRSGFTFAGWNTAADGTGTAYADGASYDFAASTTLYAQWTPVLALTGIDAAGYAGSVSALLLVGVGLISLRAVSRKRDLSS